MAIRKIKLGGVQLSLTAGPHEAGFHFSVGSGWWKRFASRFTEGRQLGKGDDAPEGPADIAGEDELARAIRQITWYHTLDLGGGIRTPGAFDHAPILENYRLPERLDGKRVLDIATYDGFWAFEFERRGAREVFAMDLEGPADIDWPPRRTPPASTQGERLLFGKGFALAKERLGSSAQRVVCNVYDLRPETFGTFDVVHAGDLLLHLTSPVKALQNMARVCTEYALISEPYFPDLDFMGTRPLVEYMGGGVVPTWWKFGLNALKEMVLDAGFARIEVLNTFHYGYRATPGRMGHAVIQAFK